MKFDVVIQFAATYPDCKTAEEAEARVRKLLKKLPPNVDVDAIQIAPSKQEKLYQFLEKELGVKKERIAKAINTFDEK